MAQKIGVIAPYFDLSSACLWSLATEYEFDPSNPALTAELLELIAQRNEVAERIGHELFGRQGPVQVRAIEGRRNLPKGM